MIKLEKTTPFYRALLDSLGPGHPLRRTVYALEKEETGPGELDDPLGEEAHSPVPGLIHTYPDKVLLLATLTCAVHCRYCTRGRLVGGPPETGPALLSEPVFRYLEAHREIRDVLVSGGDPLLLGETALDRLLGRLREIPHVRTLRLGTKLPIVDPQRITHGMARILAAHRVWLQLHVIHPAELSPEFTRACNRLADAGVPMVSQTVLLKGINDCSSVLADLFYGLLERRVKPYYLFQCDAVTGSAPFRTPLERGLQLIRELQGRICGLAMPHFAVDAPGGGGKVELLPGMALRRHAGRVFVTGIDGREIALPLDPEERDES